MQKNNFFREMIVESLLGRLSGLEKEWQIDHHGVSNRVNSLWPTVFQSRFSLLSASGSSSVPFVTFLSDTLLIRSGYICESGVKMFGKCCLSPESSGSLFAWLIQTTAAWLCVKLAAECLSLSLPFFFIGLVCLGSTGNTWMILAPSLLMPYID